MKQKYSEIEDFVESDLDSFDSYLKLQSISAQNRGINETVDYLVEKFNWLGAERVATFDEYKNPVVYAYFKGQSDKTILFYNHYDVQPPEPLDEWQSDPFVPTIHNGKLIARGVSDDKGELMSRLSVIHYFQKRGGLPCNIKFFVEGEEEIGSPDIEKYVANHKTELTCDALIWEGGGKNEAEKFEIIAGTKGIASFTVSVVTADSDIHSSLAGYIDNAAWRLVNGLATLFGSDGRIRIDHFYDHIKELDEYETQTIQRLENDFKSDKAIVSFGLRGGIKGKKPMYAAMNEPTITINGLSSGYEGPGTKTIIPRSAVAKMDCRLVAGQDPATIAKLVQKQLIKNGFTDLKISYDLGEEGFRTDLKSNFVQENLKVARDVYGNDNVVLVPNQAGGGPMAVFYKHLHAPIVAVGVRNANGGAHAPNENIRIADYRQGSAYMAALIEDYALID